MNEQYINIKTIIQKCKQMIKQAFLSQVVTDDSTPYPQARVEYNKKQNDVIRLSPYGLCSNPPIKCFSILLSSNAQESVKFALFAEMNARKRNLKEGESCLYNDLTESFVLMRADGSIHIDSKTDVVVDVVGDVTATVGGSMTATVTENITASCKVASITASTTLDIISPVTGISDDCNIGGNLVVTGTISSGVSVSAPLLAAGTSLTVNSKEMKEHKHNYTWTDPAGSGTTGEPN